mmetsp:Transcript_1117/g.3545  ORF Transcript_1117/g.3545 Transcript_1117/m.3545 type:complete len:297 (+) Transcript_1117:764-1654(+)
MKGDQSDLLKASPTQSRRSMLSTLTDAGLACHGRGTASPSSGGFAAAAAAGGAANRGEAPAFAVGTPATRGRLRGRRTAGSLASPSEDEPDDAKLSSGSFSSRRQRLRTDESERPGREAAIWRHRNPCRRTPSRMIESSSLVHIVRPWSKPLMWSSSSAVCGSTGGIQSGPMPHESSSSSSLRRPSPPESLRASPCRRCSLCHRLRTPSAVRSGSEAAMRPHCVPRRRNAARIVRSSSGFHSALRSGALSAMGRSASIGFKVTPSKEPGAESADGDVGSGASGETGTGGASSSSLR